MAPSEGKTWAKQAEPGENRDIFTVWRFDPMVA